MNIQSDLSPGLPRKRVAVLTDDLDAGHQRLLDGLARLYPVEFRKGEPTAGETVDGLLVFNGRISEGVTAAARGVPAYVVVHQASAAGAVSRSEVRFGTSPVLEECLRGQVLLDRQTGSLPAIEVEAGDEVVAACGDQAVWINRPAGRGSCQLVAAAPPLLAEKEFLFQHLNGGCFLRLLPLVNFLRELTRGLDWQSPPPRACLVIDDPSLYWPSYGFVNYRQLEEHTRRHGYSVAIASIPIDSWWVSRTVARTFRSGSPRLSVLIHGNNHTSCELLSGVNGATGLEVAAQALRRMDRLQEKHGINVHKIMVAPHAAISADLLPVLLRLGYEAALVTTELLVQHNPQTAWPLTVGLSKSQVLGGGLPIIPRIRFSADWKGDALLAVFCQQPVVIAMHHQDARHNLETLENMARTINCIKGLTWSDPRGILRSNYLYRQTGEIFEVRLHARCVSVALPPGVRFLRVERPWLEEGRQEDLLIESARGTAAVTGCGAYSNALAVEDVDTVQISSRFAGTLDYSTVAPPPVNFWPFARKFFMEMRDRCTPALLSLGWRGNWPDTDSE